MKKSLIVPAVGLMVGDQFRIGGNLYRVQSFMELYNGPDLIHVNAQLVEDPSLVVHIRLPRQTMIKLYNR